MEGLRGLRPVEEGGECRPPIRSQLLLKLERRNLEGRRRLRTLLCVNFMTLGQYLKCQMRSNVVKFAMWTTFLVYTPITQKVTGRFAYFFHYTTECIFCHTYGGFLVNPTASMQARSVLRVSRHRLKRDGRMFDFTLLLLEKLWTHLLFSCTRRSAIQF